jgi:hypothetical protein
MNAVVDRAYVDLEGERGQRQSLATVPEGHDLGVNGAVTHAKIIEVTRP